MRKYGFMLVVLAALVVAIIPAFAFGATNNAESFIPVKNADDGSNTTADVYDIDALALSMATASASNRLDNTSPDISTATNAAAVFTLAPDRSPGMTANALASAAGTMNPNMVPGMSPGATIASTTATDTGSTNTSSEDAETQEEIVGFATSANHIPDRAFIAG